MRQAIRRELRVAFSRNAQPIWFRILKWAIIITLTVLFWRKPIFWWCALGGLALAVCLHLLYRTKTHCWTRPWGGWDDLQAIDEARSGRGCL